MNFFRRGREKKNDDHLTTAVSITLPTYILNYFRDQAQKKNMSLSAYIAEVGGAHQFSRVPPRGEFLDQYDKLVDAAEDWRARNPGDLTQSQIDNYIADHHTHIIRYLFSVEKKFDSHISKIFDQQIRSSFKIASLLKEPFDSLQYPPPDHSGRQDIDHGKLELNYYQRLRLYESTLYYSVESYYSTAKILMLI